MSIQPPLASLTLLTQNNPDETHHATGNKKLTVTLKPALVGSKLPALAHLEVGRGLGWGSGLV